MNFYLSIFIALAASSLLAAEDITQVATKNLDDERQSEEADQVPNDAVAVPTIRFDTVYELDERGNPRPVPIEADWDASVNTPHHLLSDEAKLMVDVRPVGRFDNWDGSVDAFVFSRSDDREMTIHGGSAPQVGFESSTGANTGIRLRASRGLSVDGANDLRAEYAWLGARGKEIFSGQTGGNFYDYTYEAKFHSLESNLVISNDEKWNGINALLGFRYITMNDSLDLSDRINSNSFRDRQEAKNRMIGPQLGFNVTRNWDNVFLNASVKAGFFLNRVDETGPAFSGPRPIGSIAPRFARSDNAYSTLGEYDLSLGYRINDRSTIELGVFGMSFSKASQVRNSWGSPSETQRSTYLGLSAATSYDF